MDTVDVVVIGAGVAGLSAVLGLVDEAKAHGRAVPKIQVLEARDRVGGRLQTVSHFGRAFNTGAQWMHGGLANQFWAWVSARYPDMTQDYTIDKVEHSYVVTEDGLQGREFRVALSQAFDAAWDEFCRDCPNEDISLSDLEARYLNTSQTRAFAEFMANCWMGVDCAADISCVEFFGDPNATGGVQLKGGNQQLVERMAHEAQAHGVVISKGFDVARVVEMSDGYSIVARDGRAVMARHVGVSAPLSVLRAGGIVFEPALSSVSRSRMDGVGQASMTKVFLPVNERFFKERNIQPDTRVSVMIDGERPVFVHMLTNGTAGVTLFTGGAYAREVEGYDKVQLRQFIDDTCHKVQLLHDVAPYIEGAPYVTQWSRDAYAGGAYTAVLPGHRRDGVMQVLNRGFVHGRLGQSRIVLMGEGVCLVEDGPGGVSSAHLSGMRAAKVISSALEVSVAVKRKSLPRLVV